MAYNSFPYTDFHELNLDYLLNKSKEIEGNVTETAQNVERATQQADRATQQANASANSAIASSQSAQASAQSASASAQSAQASAQSAEEARAAAGDPKTFTASTQLTDTTKIYVYVGETGTYTYGHYYYYQAGSWHDGGVYGTWATDDALSDTSTNAVQNKVVTGAVNSLKSDIEASSGQIIAAIGGTESNPLSDTSFVRGSIDLSTGRNASSSARVRYDTYFSGNNILFCINDLSYTVNLCKYQNDAVKTFISNTELTNKYTLLENGYLYRFRLDGPGGAVIDLDVAPTVVSARTLTYDPDIIPEHIDLTTLESGYINSSGQIRESAVHGYITMPVLGESVLYYNAGVQESVAYLALYNADDECISTTLGSGIEQTINVPENAVLCRATFHLGTTYSLRYLIPYTVITDAISNVGTKAALPYFVLPEKSYGVVGHEWNLYFDNVIAGLNDQYDIVCSVSPSIGSSYCKEYERFLRIVPQNAGTYTITLSIVETITAKVIETAAISFIVMADTLAAQKNVMFIGDSLTTNGIYSAEVTKVLNTNLVSVGTIERTCTIGDTSYTVKHEGRAGWSAQNYVENSSVSGTANAFWNPSTSKFDFSYYMTQNGANVGVPDIVCIGLGTNGWSDPVSETAAVEEMITSIHAYNSNILCLVSLVTPPATQNGCGHHNGLQSSKGLKRGELILVQKYLEAFENRDDNVGVYELYFNLDCENDFATVTIPLSSRNPGTWVCQNNNVHPNEYGYLKFADVIYANLLYHFGS